MIKVGVWGPGSMGVIALRAVIDHPELHLVGVVVHSDAKAGRDAGELCGSAPVGVVATQDPAQLLAGDADVVVYAYDRPRWTAACPSLPPASTPGSPMTFCHWCSRGSPGSSNRCG